MTDYVRNEIVRVRSATRLAPSFEKSKMDRASTRAAARAAKSRKGTKRSTKALCDIDMSGNRKLKELYETGIQFTSQHLRSKKTTDGCYSSRFKEFVKYALTEGGLTPDNLGIDSESNCLDSSKRCTYDVDLVRLAMNCLVTEKLAVKGLDHSGGSQVQAAVKAEYENVMQAFDNEWNPGICEQTTRIITSMKRKDKRSGKVRKHAVPMKKRWMDMMHNWMFSEEAALPELTAFFFQAFFSLCFILFARTDLILKLKWRDVYENESSVLNIIVRWRKTGVVERHGRIYGLHPLNAKDESIDAGLHLRKYMKFLGAHGHKINQDDFVFPDIDVGKGNIYLGAQMDYSKFSSFLLMASKSARISLRPGEFMSPHTFRRGGAYYRFFDSHDGLWPLHVIKWWGGWGVNERPDTIAKYLLREMFEEEVSYTDILDPSSAARSELASYSHGPNSLSQLADSPMMKLLKAIATKLDIDVDSILGNECDDPVDLCEEITPSFRRASKFTTPLDAVGFTSRNDIPRDQVEFLNLLDEEENEAEVLQAHAVNPDKVRHRSSAMSIIPALPTVKSLEDLWEAWIMPDGMQFWDDETKQRLAEDNSHKVKYSKFTTVGNMMVKFGGVEPLLCHLGLQNVKPSFTKVYDTIRALKPREAGIKRPKGKVHNSNKKRSRSLTVLELGTLYRKLTFEQIPEVISHSLPVDAIAPSGVVRIVKRGEAGFPTSPPNSTSMLPLESLKLVSAAMEAENRCEYDSMEIDGELERVLSRQGTSYSDFVVEYNGGLFSKPLVDTMKHIASYGDQDSWHSSLIGSWNYICSHYKCYVTPRLLFDVEYSPAEFFTLVKAVPVNGCIVEAGEATRDPVEMLDFSLLAEENWLNDVTINTGLRLFTFWYPEKLKQLLFLSAFFLTSCHRAGNRPGWQLRWLRRAQASMGSIKTILIPINIRNSHWAFAAVELEMNRIRVWDSIYPAGKPGRSSRRRDSTLAAHYSLNHIEEFVKVCREDASIPHTPLSFVFEETPQQPRGSGSCGVYTLVFAECYILGVDPFSVFGRDSSDGQADTLAISLRLRLMLSMLRFMDYYEGASAAGRKLMQIGGGDLGEAMDDTN